MIKKILKKARRKIYKTAKDIKEMEADKRLKNWYDVKGDKTLRINYDILNENSVVFDLGGYEGQFASDIYSKYLCHVYVFEPIKKYYEGIQARFSRNKKIHIYNFGISNADKETTFGLLEDGTSEFKNVGKKESVILKSFEHFIKENNIEKIDLLKVNIEGGEYELFLNMPHSILDKIKHIQIQFHDFFADSEQKMNEIHKKFSETHQLEWQYKFVWESWKKIK
ncbi:FkbM family methyltransferase [Pigmentibacter ruber]